MGPGPSFRYAYEGNDEDLKEEGIPEFERVLVYPNPATAEVTVVLPLVPEKPWRLSINSIPGSVVKEIQLYDRIQRITLSGVSVGMYYLRVYSEMEEQRYAEKLVIVDE